MHYYKQRRAVHITRVVRNRLNLGIRVHLNWSSFASQHPLARSGHRPSVSLSWSHGRLSASVRRTRVKVPAFKVSPYWTEPYSEKIFGTEVGFVQTRAFMDQLYPPAGCASSLTPRPKKVGD